MFTVKRCINYSLFSSENIKDLVWKSDSFTAADMRSYVRYKHVSPSSAHPSLRSRLSILPGIGISPVSGKLLGFTVDI